MSIETVLVSIRKYVPFESVCDGRLLNGVIVVGKWLSPATARSLSPPREASTLADRLCG